MSESWQPDESEIWQTRPSESSHPSFPFADREVNPFSQPLSASQPIPPPPPPPFALDAARQDNRATEPIIGTTFGMGIGVIVGAVATLGILAALLSYVLLNGGLGVGNHSHSSETNTSSLSAGGSTQGGSGGGNSSKGGGGGNQGGAGGPGVTGTNGATAAPGTTPINTGTPGASMTATTIAATGTATPSLPTLTPTPGALPLTVTATAQDHKSITINVQTLAGAALTVTVTFCDGTHSPAIVGSAGNGTYSNTITNGIPKCAGNLSDMVAVTGHLAGYNDTTVTITATQV